MDKQAFRSGFVTIIGKPNVGKSTLLNQMVGEKIAIVSDRPQTTRNRIMGVVHREHTQLVFLDTPGIHHPRNRLGNYMMQSVQDALDGMDCVVVMMDVTKISQQEQSILDDIKEKKVPKVLALNKLDLVEPESLLEIINRYKDTGFEAIIPISAKTGDGVEDLVCKLEELMPEGPKYFPDDMMTDQPERMIIAEMIREKALLHLRDEVPHGIGVEILGIEKINDGLTEIHATIYCEREAHKSIIIGKHGSMLQTIGSESRGDIERLMDTHVNLKLWVKVRTDWRNRVDDLRTLGYDV